MLDVERRVRLLAEVSFDGLQQAIGLGPDQFVFEAQYAYSVGGQERISLLIFLILNILKMALSV